ncbi:hypothetical protein ACUN7V_10930 [Quadrisphaera oryzae]|uniref:hypothetical protein n=1 Tax=Quadrisphaera TaxID=317661 RepID=UPI0016491338|nr:hypothetical protein [Quadrisphaera sp. RL12-1S]MBC3762183.1 hypothetical protein [Quadrisphaera sp. RL12-1S]
MVNENGLYGLSPARTALPLANTLVTAYLLVVVCTLLALGALTVAAPSQANDDAWGHALVVAVFAVLLPLRLRRARQGRRGAVRAVGLIAAVLLVVNVVEALLPGFVPTWMQVQMVLVAVLMAGIVGDVVRWAVTHHD